ncbi:molybdenum cofactor biosynthesis protein A [delta proteobacterium NaphS2]|nr:molybdenum cofactor biosynthesis protein A [delta proteobacterium NaphS2]
METKHHCLIDHYQRHLNYLRISITDRCNLRCQYCMPPEGREKLRHEDILSYEEILRLARVAIRLGVDKIRLTGGEPLVRKDFPLLLPELMSIPGLKDVSITTNGIYLKEHLESILSAGVTRLNISLDSLRRDRYQQITGFDGFDRVHEAIGLAHRMGFHPIKINMVVLDGINDDEVLDFARLSVRYPFHVRFIEYMPSGLLINNKPLRHVSNTVIRERLEAVEPLIQIPREAIDGPTVRYRFKDAPGEIGFISPLTHHFCQICNRLRITANGHLRPCLLSDEELDLKGPMRSGATNRDLEKIFLEAADRKPRSHCLDTRDDTSLSGQMSAIGG